MSIRTINYIESNPQTYKSVKIWVNKDNEFVFDSGDFVKDWFNSLKFVLTGGLGEYPRLSDSSSVNHFIMDGGSGLYDSAWLVIDETSAELVYDYTDEGYEVFVTKGTKPTWKELKESCS